MERNTELFIRPREHIHSIQREDVKHSKWMVVENMQQSQLWIGLTGKYWHLNEEY